MRTILKQFYLGNLTPSERRMPPSSNLQRAVNRVSQCEKQLMEQLNESEQSHLKEMVDTQYEIDNITACDNFILGFRLGVRMMAECMDENDGDTRPMINDSCEEQSTAGTKRPDILQCAAEPGMSGLWQSRAHPRAAFSP